MSQLNFTQLSETLAFTPQRFHVLIHSLFKVLFNFPSRYLFAIGPTSVFSFRWGLPPTLSCIPKQLDSNDLLWFAPLVNMGLTPAMGKTHSNVLRLVALPHCKTYMSHDTLLRKQSALTLSSSLFIRHYWGNHCYFLFLRLVICLNSASALV